MTGRVEGKVAFITGAARGQGRSHAVRLAEEGANIIAVDVCKQLDGVPIPMSTPEDLDETVSLVEKAGGKIYAAQADVRDMAAMQAIVDDGVAQFGRSTSSAPTPDSRARAIASTLSTKKAGAT